MIIVSGHSSVVSPSMTRTINLLILLIFLPAVVPGGLFVREQWQSVGNDNGVAIYSRKVAGHEESEFKGITEINRLTDCRNTAPALPDTVIFQEL